MPDRVMVWEMRMASMSLGKPCISWVSGVAWTVFLLLIVTMGGGCKRGPRPGEPRKLKTRLAPWENRKKPVIPPCCKTHKSWSTPCICTANNDIYFVGFLIADDMAAKYLVATTTQKGHQIEVSLCVAGSSPLDSSEAMEYVGRIVNLKKGTYVVTVRTDPGRVLGSGKVKVAGTASGAPSVKLRRMRGFFFSRGLDAIDRSGKIPFVRGSCKE